jgi:hypothetical protein
VGYCLHNLFLLPAPTLTTSFRGAQAIFLAKPLEVQYSNTVTLHTYSPTKMEHTQCSEILAFNLQTPGNSPEESIWQCNKVSAGHRIPWKSSLLLHSSRTLLNYGPGSSVGIATGYGLDGLGIESRWGRDFSHTSRPALEPTQPPVQWVPGLSQG